MDADPHGNNFKRKLNNKVEECTILSLVIGSSTACEGGTKYAKGFRTD